MQKAAREKYNTFFMDLQVFHKNKINIFKTPDI